MFWDLQNRTSVSMSAYQHLLRLYSFPLCDEKEESLNALPEEFRKKIRDNVRALAEGSSTFDPARMNIFASPARLQEAIQQVVFAIFASLTRDQQNKITWKIWMSCGSPDIEDPNWVEGDVVNDPSILLKAMSKTLGDLTPKLEQILTTWMCEGELGEKRPEAYDRIIHFLKKTAERELDLKDLSLKSLPPIFNHPPFARRLTSLLLSHNKLTTLPEGIVLLQNLQELFLDDNQLTSLPKQIGQLQNLQELLLSGNQLTVLPEEIGLLQKLEYLNLAHNLLTTLPDQICELHPLDCLCLNDNQLLTLPEKIGQLSELRTLDLSSNINFQGLPRSSLKLSDTCQVHLQSTCLSERIADYLRITPNAITPRGPILRLDRQQCRFPLSLFEEMYTAPSQIG